MARWVPVVVCLLACAGCRTQADAPANAPKPTLRIAGTRLAQALVDEFATTPLHVAVEAVQANVLEVPAFVRDGRADVGVSFADSVYFAYSSDRGDLHPRAHDLRAISTLHVARILAYVRPDAGITSVAHLRGRTVRVAPPPTTDDPRFASWPVPRSLTGSGSGTVSGVTSMPQVVLLAHGVLPDQVTNRPVGPPEAIDELFSGTLDAVFAMDFESNAFAADASKRGAVLLPIEGHAVDRLRREYSFIRPIRIPAGTYPGQRAPVHTVGVDMVLICRADLDEQVVYELTRAYFAALPRVSAQGDLPQLDPEQAPSTPIPLHEGAARYYRESELFR